MHDGSALAAAADWATGLLSGPLAVGLATLGVAGFGLSMLAGRLELRRGLAVILGCFVLLGAPAMARGLLGLLDIERPAPVIAPQVAHSEPAIESRTVQTTDDPYAGASLVPRQ